MELRGTALGLALNSIAQEDRSWIQGRTGAGIQGGEELGPREESHGSWLLEYELQRQMRGLGAAEEAQAD